MIRFLGLIVALSLSVCMGALADTSPPAGAALEARLSGQIMSNRPVEPSIGVPRRIELHTDKTAILTYRDGREETFGWKVEDQRLCFYDITDPDRHFCQSVVITTDNRFAVYGRLLGETYLVSTGELTPL